MSALGFVLLTVALCWTYDFFNGMNDAANAIATVVASGTLTPGQAIALARTLNLVGALLSTRVAFMVGQGIVPPELATGAYLVAALGGAIVWTAFCTFMGLPISITHALIGGLVGPAIALGHFTLVNTGDLLRIVVYMAVAPVVGFIAGLCVMWFVGFALEFVPWAHRELVLRRGQLLSAAFVALTHGSNDTQNAMGIITAALVVGGFLGEFRVPLWVKLGSAVFMALGTWAGGWRVIDTLGHRLVDIDAARGFSAELGASVVVAGVTLMGIPISTTQVISAAILGTAARDTPRSINWSVAGDIGAAWLLTLPGSGLAAAITYWLIT